MNSSPFNARSDARRPANIPGPGDDVLCGQCGSPLDTGLECTECGFDMAPALEAQASEPGERNE